MDAAWRITCWYLVLLTVIVMLAKIASIRAAGGRLQTGTASFLLSPSLCITSWRRRGRLPEGRVRRVLLRALLTISLIVPVYLYFVPEVRRAPWWVQSYLAILPFWLVLETLQSLCQLLWLPSGGNIPAINVRPWSSRSVAEFWGRRWNRLFGDWLRQIVFTPLRRRPQLAMAATFLVSGVLHELLVSLPLHIVYGQSVWGWLTGYFFLQYLAILLERRLQLGSPITRRLFLWPAVLGPVPLVLNPGTLLIFHLGG